MQWYDHVSEDAKAAFYLFLTEKVLDKISHYEWFHHVKETMNMCWNWIEERGWSGHDLYERLDDEESETGLFSIHMNEVDAGLDDDEDELAFFCVIDAVAYTVWQACKYEEKGYVPQAIEVVNDEFTDGEFMRKICQIHDYQEEWAERLKQYLMKNHLAGSDKKIQREELLSLIL
ncbi:hypothetical protein H1R82_09175 [Thermoactinomyces intermedius]|jgi:Immunity protein Imm6|uniref:Immunity protein Imm6 n=1 Tax=Thermoactinomyces intermedius TaxID=2024 RepID=A0A8I1AEJ5_THEIN|nr:Imm6 family immunity protein [Thermoactinomyces intermedius]MBA4548725.1 hypothetical protein [Thermoactinomyces intermedius]MBA4836799.1 hypothetical protein [Thermoactinomyces intermedius]MBH8594603.1 hypothetical protein [Thermoactinomyces intermedius]